MTNQLTEQKQPPNQSIEDKALILLNGLILACEGTNDAACWTIQFENAKQFISTHPKYINIKNKQP